MERRGFLGLLGKSIAATPFLGAAVALRADPITGALTIDDKKICEAVTPMPIAADDDFLVIPMRALRSAALSHRMPTIDITRIDSNYREFAYGLAEPAILDLSIYADSTLIEEVAMKLCAYFETRRPSFRGSRW